VVAAALLLAGCGDGGAKEAQSDDGVANPPQEELASLIGDQGALRYRLDAADAAHFTTIVLAARGFTDDERRCAAPAVGAVLSPEAGGQVSLARFGRLVNRMSDPTSDLSKQLTTCESDATEQRIEEQRSADDLDLTGFVDLAHRMAAGQAAAVGMDPQESACYADRALDGVDVERFVRAVVGYEDSQGADPIGAVEACLDKPRLTELVVAGRKLKADYEECARERAEEQANAVNEALSSSTTLPPGGTTTTLPPCA
jgi:hypothetical protein